MATVGEKRSRVPTKRELSKLEKSPPCLKKQMTDEQLARFLQEQEELLSNDSSFGMSFTDENRGPLNRPSPQRNQKEMTKDEQLAWKLQMEEQYYERLYFQREGTELEEVNSFEYDDSDNIFDEENSIEPERKAELIVLEDNSDSESEEVLFEVNESNEQDSDNEDDDEEEEGAIFESYEELLQLSEIVPPVSKGIKSEDIVKLGSFKITAEQITEYENCNVCLEDFENDDECRLLSCNHAYHSNCIDQWLTINKICPVCRKEIC